MFTYKRTIFLRETDSTGVLFFSEQFNICLEAFEAFFQSQGLHLHEMIEMGKIFLPIVHAEGDYSAPLSAGDRVEVRLRVGKLGTTSFTLDFQIVKEGLEEEVGKAQIVHVVIARDGKGAIPIPDDLQLLLSFLKEHR
ncbi:MAG: 1,4-dihydroxy-2-naphthoyl-CoA hydrolase [Chlamydiae bacterium]|nr:1,4-dihydroxy-2-naphthoyl-CoA hydrolase [Chlamydiota bacterium]